MRILILGGDGMLGHVLFSALRDRHEVRVTVRQPLDAYRTFGLFEPTTAFDAIDARGFDRLAEVFNFARPDAVVNCIGLVKQRNAAKDAISSLEINALLPHRLALLSSMVGAKLIHISTDCVFSGRKGSYLETDASDAEDLYGRTKFLGEVSERHCLTLRTSIIGYELSRKTGLLEWFLAQKGPVPGYSKAIFSGVTTVELSRVIERMLTEHKQASGTYQVSSEPIDKYSLLVLFRKYLAPQIDVVPDTRLIIDRSLNSSRFRREFGYQPPSWDDMVQELADSKPASRSSA